MSLIIDALQKAQQLRFKNVQGIPFFKAQQPSDEKTHGKSRKRHFLPLLGLILLILFLAMVCDPIAFLRRESPLPSLSVQAARNPVLPTEKKQEDPEEILPSPGQETREGLSGENSPATKKEAPALEQIETEQQKPRSKPLARTVVSKPLSRSRKAPSEPLKTSLPLKEKPPSSPALVTEEILKPPHASTEILTLFNQGVLYQNEKETGKAIQAYQKVIESDPGNFEAYNNLGLAYQEIGDADRACQAYRRAIEISPVYEKALNNLGILFYQSGRYQEALESFQKAISVHPETIESYLNLGILFKKQGQWDKAVDSFQKAFTINLLHGETHYNAALLYEQMNQVDLAIDHYRKFVQLSSKKYPVLVSEVQKHLDALSGMKREK